MMIIVLHTLSTPTTGGVCNFVSSGLLSPLFVQTSVLAFFSTPAAHHPNSDSYSAMFFLVLLAQSGHNMTNFHP